MLLAAALAAVTFSHDVAPILYRQCAGCHRAGGVAPFPLLTYTDVAKHAAQIATVTRKHFMPPWLPSAPRFQGERKLSDAEIATLAAWAAGGAPQGNPAEAPRPPVFPSGWSLGKPDAETEMRSSFDIPAEGLDLYQCFDVPDPSARARYLRAIDIQPGNPKVVHHALLFQDTTGTARRRDTGQGYSCFGTPGFLPAHGLGGWTPGALPLRMPAGMPELLHGNSDLVLQIHYHPTGKPEKDLTRIALYYTDEVPKAHAQDIPLGSSAIDIPPGERAYKVTDHFTIPVDVDVIGVNPHAHYVCVEMTGIAILPSGRRITLIHIPRWDFNWQQQYLYPAPLRLPADTRVEMEFVYDNSAANPRNPHSPPQRVRYGPGSSDEMAGLHLTVVPVDGDDAEELSQTLWGKMMRALGPRR